MKIKITESIQTTREIDVTFPCYRYDKSEEDTIEIYTNYKFTEDKVYSVRRSTDMYGDTELKIGTKRHIKLNGWGFLFKPENESNEEDFLDALSKAKYYLNGF